MQQSPVLPGTDIFCRQPVVSLFLDIVCDISRSIAGRQSLHEGKEIFRFTGTEIAVPRF